MNQANTEFFIKAEDQGGSQDPQFNAFLQHSCKALKMSDPERLAHPLIIGYGNPNVTLYLALDNLPDDDQVKDRLGFPLWTDSTFTGLLFKADSSNEKDIHIGEGNLILNIDADESTYFVTDDMYTLMVLSHGKHPVLFASPNDRVVLNDFLQKNIRLCFICAIHQKNDLKRRLRHFNNDIHVIGLSEPVTAFSEQYEVNREVMELLKAEIDQSWQEPIKISSELLPVTKLSPEMLPSEFADYVFDEAKRADNMSPDMVAVCLMTAFASVVGAKVGIKPKANDDWMIIPNLWGGIVAPPSSKKSPAFDAGTYPIKQLVAEAKKKFENDIQENGADSFVLDTKIKQCKNKLAEAVKSEDKELESTLRAELMELGKVSTLQPILRRYSTNDATPEALAEIEKSNPNGILVLRDELTGWFDSVDKEPSARAFFLEGFDGNKPYQFDRIIRGSGYIENHCLSILGGIQPDKLVTYLEPSIKGRGNDGLFQRFQLLVYPDETEWQYIDQKPNVIARSELVNLFTQIDSMTLGDLSNMGAVIDQDVNSRPYFRFSETAQKIWVDWSTNLNQKVIQNEEYPIIAQHLQKYPKLMASIALIFHLLEGIRFGSVDRVSEQSALMAVEWCNYLESHARRIYGLVLNAATSKAASLGLRLKKLSYTDDWIVNGFKARDIQRKNWKSLTDLHSVEAALDILVDYHWLNVKEVFTTDRGGRPTKQFYINPKIYN
ncbi:DUF3987 domain-containing protein [Acinetobacter wanghuae]|uniref:DUF3987 domain-containing protein n=1 Tax=Acinetobacter wanghuae TaxID=2662362 RepID=A0A5Q0P109_9GAMM|nr:YfjI family protein [Acinetobacter wanghuae]MQW93381.1 DUF3987 domain-containing protein [Acinetobacter wanghuae]QGA10779.1 DUF3987 domain-containing protein [Acinetobacter wanghuae]